MIKRFLDLNRKLSHWIEGYLPNKFDRSLLWLHRGFVVGYLNRSPGQVLVDAGGGRYSPYGKACETDKVPFAIALDISEDELTHNEDVDCACVADLSLSLPLRDSVADLLVTRSVMEHLPSNEEFIHETHRVLKPAGYAIHVFPCKFSPFSIINQILPHRLAQRILYYFFPEWRESCGFKAYYRNCHYFGIKRLLEQSDFEIEEIHFRYYQSIYYDFFVPLYLVMLVYDALTYGLNAKPLACQILVVAKKR